MRNVCTTAEKIKYITNNHSPVEYNIGKMVIEVFSETCSHFESIAQNVFELKTDLSNLTA